MPATSSIRQRGVRDSWPPTQLRLQEPEKDEEMEVDPLTYFLTPTPLLQADDDDDVDMFDIDLDAGIEDTTKKNPPIIRSISPSSLGLVKGPFRPPTPPRSSPSSPEPLISDDEDDDGEDYIRFGVGRLHALPFSLRDFASQKARRATKARDASLSPPGSPSSLSVSPSSRGRSRSSSAGRGRTPVPRSPHSWREPSPDVWDIMEETEEDLVDEKVKKNEKKLPARPLKRVRFVLPVKEE